MGLGNLIRALKNFIFYVGDSPDHNRAMLDVLAKQIPITWIMVAVSTTALAYTHLNHAPTYLTMYVPGVLVAVSIGRAIQTWRRRSTQLTDAKVRHKLLTTIILIPSLGTVFVWWAVSLYQFGDAHTQGHIAFFMGVTTFGWLVCLMHLRTASFLLVLTIVLPFAVFYGTRGEPVFLAISINMVLVTAAIVYVLHGHSQHFSKLIIHQELLEKKQQETQLLSDENARLANEDSLTELPNRRSFFSVLCAKLSAYEESAQSGLAVGIMDLDGFKPINDIYGHPTGDKLLADVGKRLSSSLGPNVYVARLGGDEFGLIIEGCRTREELHAQAEAVCALIRVPFDIGGIMAHMSGSMGLAQYDTEQSKNTDEVLFDRADYALYFAKASALGEPVIFSSDHSDQIREVSTIERRLRDADLSEEMSVVFQPIIDTGDAKVVGFEALARWQSPILGTVPPTVFIRGAERAGLINRLTELLLRKALDAARAWPDNVFLSFNLSGHDISSEECVDQLVQIVKNSGFPATRLTFEVTETAVMQDFQRANEALLRLKALGVKIALDDFGTGYSSLSYVRSLPLDRLKMDRSFIDGIVEDNAARSIVRVVIDLCRNLELECIIEGVETEDQLRIVVDMGCTRVQGYFFSKPLAQGDAEKYLKAESSIRAAS